MGFKKFGIINENWCSKGLNSEGKEFNQLHLKWLNELVKVEHNQH